MAKLLKNGLENEGYTASYCLSGKEGQENIELHTERFDLIILDVMLTDMSGIDVCKNVRTQNIMIPVIMLTAKGILEDKIAGLDAGADDYLTKPFAFEELIARIRALLRRPKVALPAVIKIGKLRLNPVTRRVSYDDKELSLTLKEFNLLEYFMMHPNQVLNREQILDKLWDLNFDSFSNVVDVHIKNLRRKLEDISNESILETVRGLGYRLKK